MRKRTCLSSIGRLATAAAVAALLASCGGLSAADYRPLELQPTEAAERASTGEHAQAPAWRLETISTVDIAAGDGRHLAFPDVARLEDGRLIVVYRQGDSHVDAAGRIVRQFGTPDGSEWTAAETIIDTPESDDRDPSVTALTRGDVLLTLFRYNLDAFEDEPVVLHHVFVATSVDDGETFGAIVQVDPGPMEASQVTGLDGTAFLDADGERIRVMGVSSPVVDLDELLVLPAYGGDSVDLSNLSSAPRSRIVLWRSDDEGESWQGEAVNHDAWPDSWLMEPALLKLSSHRVLMHIRTAETDSPGGAGPMAQAVSDDGGRTFGEWRALDVIGHAPDLLELSTGEVISAFRWLDEAYENANVGLIVSSDQGDNWSEPLLIEACGDQECGYPSMTELEGGRVLIVYYAEDGAVIRGKTIRIAQ